MKQPVPVNDLSFLDYNARQLNEILPESNGKQALKTQPAGNFYYNNKIWQPVKYEGFAIVSMVDDNEGNELLANRLTEIQHDLKDNLQPVQAFYQLPPESFHQTVANTLSNDRFTQNIQNAGLEDVYPDMVAHAFDNISSRQDKEPIKMKMIGLSIFGTAIAMLGVFEEKEHYESVTRFRRELYKNEQLTQLDVKMTRPFIGHITLTYIEQNLNINQRNHLAEVINELNSKIEHEQLHFNITKTGLRRYHHLAAFIKKDNFPVYYL